MDVVVHGDVVLAGAAADDDGLRAGLPGARGVPVVGEPGPALQPGVLAGGDAHLGAVQVTGVVQHARVHEGLGAGGRGAYGGAGLRGVGPVAGERGDPGADDSRRRDSAAEGEQAPAGEAVLVGALGCAGGHVRGSGA